MENPADWLNITIVRTKPVIFVEELIWILNLKRVRIKCVLRQYSVVMYKIDIIHTSFHPRMDGAETMIH